MMVKMRILLALVILGAHRAVSENGTFLSHNTTTALMSNITTKNTPGIESTSGNTANAVFSTTRTMALWGKTSSNSGSAQGASSSTFWPTIDHEKYEDKIQQLVVGVSVLGVLLLLVIVALVLLAVYFSRRLNKIDHVKKCKAAVMCSMDLDHYAIKTNGETEVHENGIGNVLSRYDVPHCAVQHENEVAEQAAGNRQPKDKGSSENRAVHPRKQSRDGEHSVDATKTFSAFFGNSYVDIFSDKTDTSQLLHLCQNYFNDRDGVSSSAAVRESIIEKIDIQPLSKGGGIDNKGFEWDKQDRRSRPMSYYRPSQKPARSSIYEETIGNIFTTGVQMRIAEELTEELTDEPSLARKSISSSEAESDWVELSDLTEQTLGMAPSNPNAIDYNQGMFVRKTIGPSGGQIQLGEVVLDFPEGAVSSEKEICLGILWQKQVFPNLSPKQTVLSPIVVCEPHSLRFNNPVKLRFPHCAHRIRTDWDLTLLKSETTEHQVANWKGLTLEDYDERTIDDNYITVSLYHFTLYTVVGEGRQNVCAAKCVNMVGFAPPLDASRFFKIRIYCTSHYTNPNNKDEMQWVQKNEVEKGGKSITVPKPLLFHDNGKHLCVELHKLSQGWTNDSEKLELDFETVWHGFTPSCEFVLRPVERKEELSCEIKSFQDGRPEKSNTIVIAEEAKHDIVADMTRPQGTFSVFPYDLRCKIIFLLDVNNILSRDWHVVAEHMHLEPSFITWLETQPSPTECVLRQWERESRTLEQFQKLMKKLDRQDVASEVGQYLTNDQCTIQHDIKDK